MAVRSVWASKSRVLAFGIALSAALSGCDFLDQLNREVEALKIVMTGGSSPLAVRPSPSPKPYEYGEAAKRSRANGETLHEVLQVVLLREPKGPEYTGYVDVLNQGASIEGLYNGFTHSADYRKMEASSGSASAGALKVFAELLAAIEAELPVPTPFDPSSAQPLPVLDERGGAVSGQIDVSAFGEATSPSPVAVDTAGLAEKYSKVFVGASIFTLKRVLGDEALKLMASKKEFPEKLALWYSRWVVQMTSKGVDFGLELRNKPDEKFHFDWAVKVSEDRLKWEVLNRFHRVLNDAERKSR